MQLPIAKTFPSIAPRSACAQAFGLALWSSRNCIFAFNLFLPFLFLLSPPLIKWGAYLIKEVRFRVGRRIAHARTIIEFDSEILRRQLFANCLSCWDASEPFAICNVLGPHSKNIFSKSPRVKPSSNVEIASPPKLLISQDSWHNSVDPPYTAHKSLKAKLRGHLHPAFLSEALRWQKAAMPVIRPSNSKKASSFRQLPYPTTFSFRLTFSQSRSHAHALEDALWTGPAKACPKGVGCSIFVGIFNLIISPRSFTSKPNCRRFPLLSISSRLTDDCLALEFQAS